MKARIKKKIFTNMYNPKMHYSINQIAIATDGLFLLRCLYCGKITKFDKEEPK